jgi:hypothetical protein
MEAKMSIRLTKSDWENLIGKTYAWTFDDLDKLLNHIPGTTKALIREGIKHGFISSRKPTKYEQVNTGIKTRLYEYNY